MTKIPKKSLLKPEKPIRIEVPPSQIYSSGIHLPTIKYHLVGTVENKQVFNGDVLPIPIVLIHFLSHTQLLVLSCIMDECMKRGKCYLSVPDMAKRINKSKNAVSIAMNKMRNANLLKEGRGSRKGTCREINYKGVQRLYDLVQGEDPGIYVRLRGACGRKQDIMHITKKDIENSYDNKVLPPNHDPEEEEEYD